MTDTAIRTFLMGASTLLLTAAGAATAVGQPGVRAIVQPASERKAAPQLALKDSTGKTISLTDYRGKVVLLDFWANTPGIIFPNSVPGKSDFPKSRFMARPGSSRLNLQFCPSTGSCHFPRKRLCGPSPP